jgi:hypothetical protein
MEFWGCSFSYVGRGGQQRLERVGLVLGWKWREPSDQHRSCLDDDWGMGRWGVIIGMGCKSFTADAGLECLGIITTRILLRISGA